MQCVAAIERPLAGTWSGGPKAGCSRNTMPYGAGSMGRDVTDSRIRFGIGHGTEGMEKSFRVNETQVAGRMRVGSPSQDSGWRSLAHERAAASGGCGVSGNVCTVAIVSGQFFLLKLSVLSTPEAF